MAREYRVTLRHPKRQAVQFGCGPSTPVYRAASRVGIVVETACERGGCGGCRARVIEGQVTHLQPVSRKQLRDPQSGEPVVLLCQAVPRSNLVLQPTYPWKELPVNPFSSLLAEP